MLRADTGMDTSAIRIYGGTLEVAACQPKILSDADHTKFEYAGASGGFIDKHGYPFCRGRIFDTVETDNGQYNDITDIFWLLVSRADGAHGGISHRWWSRQGFLRPHGGNRPVLASAPARDRRYGSFRRAWCSILAAAAYRRQTRRKPTSTSATICFCSTRICRRAKADGCS